MSEINKSDVLRDTKPPVCPMLTLAITRAIYTYLSFSPEEREEVDSIICVDYKKQTAWLQPSTETVPGQLTDENLDEFKAATGKNPTVFKPQDLISHSADMGVDIPNFAAIRQIVGAWYRKEPLKMDKSIVTYPIDVTKAISDWAFDRCQDLAEEMNKRPEDVQDYDIRQRYQWEDQDAEYNLLMDVINSYVSDFEGKAPDLGVENKRRHREPPCYPHYSDEDTRENKLLMYYINKVAPNFKEATFNPEYKLLEVINKIMWAGCVNYYDLKTLDEYYHDNLIGRLMARDCAELEYYTRCKVNSRAELQQLLEPHNTVFWADDFLLFLSRIY